MDTDYTRKLQEIDQILKDQEKGLEKIIRFSREIKNASFSNSLEVNISKRRHGDGRYDFPLDPSIFDDCKILKICSIGFEVKSVNCELVADFVGSIGEGDPKVRFRKLFFASPIVDKIINPSSYLSYSLHKSSQKIHPNNIIRRAPGSKRIEWRIEVPRWHHNDRIRWNQSLLEYVTGMKSLFRLARIQMIYSGNLEKADEDCLNPEPSISQLSAYVKASAKNRCRAFEFSTNLDEKSTLDRGFFVKKIRFKKPMIYTEFDSPGRADLLSRFFKNIFEKSRDHERNNS